MPKCTKKILVDGDFRRKKTVILNMKCFEFKTIPKPPTDSRDLNDFNEWFSLFTSMMVAMDPVWDSILLQMNHSGRQT